jgi:hypothetical protein
LFADPAGDSSGVTLAKAGRKDSRKTATAKAGRRYLITIIKRTLKSERCL